MIEKREEEDDIPKNHAPETKFEVTHKLLIEQCENTQFCLDKVKKLLADGFSNDEILFLYRSSKMHNPYFSKLNKEDIRVQFKTIHKSKGLEAKIVFIIGLTEEKGGFPDIWLVDRIFQVIKKTDLDLVVCPYCGHKVSENKMIN
ncbi:hypothetical protein R83H12_02202 [Fibrobacteria bacterium R8-3-H12]